MTVFVAKCLWVAGVTGWYAIRYPFARRSRKTPVDRRVYRVEEFLLLTISATGLGTIPAFYVFTPLLGFADYPIRDWQPYVGGGIFLLALWMFRETHSALGRYWSVTLELKREHVLMTQGIYRLVRHPMYAAFWLWAIAQAFLLSNVIAGGAGLLGFGTLYCFRVRKEEELMVDAFGEDYRAYMNRTWRLMPRPY